MTKREPHKNWLQTIQQHFLHLARKFFTHKHPTSPLCPTSGMRGMEGPRALAVNSLVRGKRAFGLDAKLRRISSRKTNKWQGGQFSDEDKEKQLRNCFDGIARLREYGFAAAFLCRAG